MPSFHDPDLCRSILESLPTGLCVVDMQKKIVFWSDGAERITGHLRHERIGHSCISETLLHCDQPGCEFCKEDCPIARAIRTSQAAEAISFLHHKAGHEVPVRIRAVPVHNQHGSILGTVETFEVLQPAASPDHREYTLKLPRCIDNLTGVASEILMRPRLRKPDSPLDPSNRRISLIVQYIVKNNHEEDANPSAKGEQKTEENKTPRAGEKSTAKH